MGVDGVSGAYGEKIGSHTTEDGLPRQSKSVRRSRRAWYNLITIALHIIDTRHNTCQVYVVDSIHSQMDTEVN